MLEFSAFIACGILAVLTIFQFLLILGAPLGKYTQGGARTILSTSQRIICAISIILYFIFALIILNQAGVVDALNGVSDIGIWVLTILLFIGTLMNGISRSKQERIVMTPVALVLALLCLLLAVN